MDAQIEKVIAETVKEFGEEQAAPAIRVAVQRALEAAAMRFETGKRSLWHCTSAADALRSLADGAQKGMPEEKSGTGAEPEKCHD